MKFWSDDHVLYIRETENDGGVLAARQGLDHAMMWIDFYKPSVRDERSALDLPRNWIAV